MSIDCKHRALDLDICMWLLCPEESWRFWPRHFDQGLALAVVMSGKLFFFVAAHESYIYLDVWDPVKFPQVSHQPNYGYSGLPYHYYPILPQARCIRFLAVDRSSKTRFWAPKFWVFWAMTQTGIPKPKRESERGKTYMAQLVDKKHLLRPPFETPTSMSAMVMVYIYMDVYMGDDHPSIPSNNDQW